MHPKFAQASSLTGTVIASAIEVHKEMGPGLSEPIYEWCLLGELSLRNLEVTNQQKVILRCKVDGFYIVAHQTILPMSACISIF